MKGVLFFSALCGLLVLSACGSVTTPPTPRVATPNQYECRYPATKSVVLLPVPSRQGEVVNVRMSGRLIPAVYTTSGLDQFWSFEGSLSLYITLRPDGTAVYMDFRGAEPGEKRKPRSVFFCE